MATSGTYDFTVTRDEIVTAALRKIGVVDAGETPTSDELSDGAEDLNIMVKGWMAPNNFIAKGLKLWQRARASLTLSASISFDLKPSGGDCDIQIPVAIISAVLRDSDDNDTVLEPMSFEQYEALGNKTDTGTPSRYYYERSLSTGTLYLDVIPDDTTDTIEFVYLQVLEDFDSSTDNPDFPQEWYEPLVYNLALRLAPDYGVEPSQSVVSMAQVSLANAQTFAPENADSDDHFQPGKD